MGGAVMGKKIVVMVDSLEGPKRIVKDVSLMSEKTLLEYAVQGVSAAVEELARRRKSAT
jgi:uncharacterized protein (UPF0303 family)